MRQRWANWSLRLQLSLAVTLMMVLLLVVFSAVLFVSVRAFLLDQSAEQLRTRALMLLDDSAELPPTSALDPWSRLPSAPLSDALRTELQAIVEALSTQDTSAVVYQTDGTVALRGTVEAAKNRFGFSRRFGPPELSAPPAPDRRVFERVLRGDQQVSYTDYHGLDQQLAVLIPIYDSARLVGVLQVATPLQQMYTLLRWLAFVLVGGTMLVALTALLLSFWATHTILNPLRRVVGISQRVGQGDLDARTGLRSRNEIGVLGATFDQMVAQLQGSFAAQRRFIADAAHELRTPLTVVSGNVDLLMLGAASDPAQQRRSLQRMNSELERMGRLVDDLLTLSRLDAHPRLRCEDTELGALVQDTINEFRGLAPHHQWSLTLVPGIVVRGDPDRLRQVLLNVLENARKFTPEGGSIAVTVTKRHDAAVMMIADTGVGIPAEDVPHVWDRFYRVDQARARASGGSGLGLSIVKSIVETHGGHVALSSSVGQGTTVTLTLPLVGLAQHLPAPTGGGRLA
ncbi:MAG TPA: ATP-binding protein [Herpetosiphonaceae bacterium]